MISLLDLSRTCCHSEAPIVLSAINPSKENAHVIPCTHFVILQSIRMYFPCMWVLFRVNVGIYKVRIAGYIRTAKQWKCYCCELWWWESSLVKWTSQGSYPFSRTNSCSVFVMTWTRHLLDSESLGKVSDSQDGKPFTEGCVTGGICQRDPIASRLWSFWHLVFHVSLHDHGHLHLQPMGVTICITSKLNILC